MKNKKIQIVLNEPCHENWSTMLPNDQGRFCDSCAKSVVDFSTYSDSEILKFLAVNKDQKTCGRFHYSQLERPLIQTPVYSGMNSSFSLRAVLLGATLSSFLSIESAYGQETELMMPIQSEPIHNWGPNLGQKRKKEYDHSTEKRIVGTIMILDVPEHRTEIITKSYPSVMAKITVMNKSGDEIGKTYSNKNGTFIIELDWKLNPVYLNVEQFGSLSQNLKLDQIAHLEEMKIILYPVATYQRLGSFEMIEK